MNIKSKTYAQSLWENIEGDNLAQVNEILETMFFVANVYEHDKMVRDFLNHPQIAAESKEKLIHVIVKTAKAPEVLAHFLSLLLRQRQLKLLPAVLKHLNEIRNLKFGVLQTKVSSAVALNEQQKQVLSESLRKAFQAQSIMLEEAVDKSLLGGLMVQVNDLVINNTLSYKLSKVKERIRST